MGIADNPYRAPDASVAERPASGHRPLHVFLAGAIAIGASIVFLLLTAAGSMMFVRRAIEGDLHLIWENRRYQIDGLFTALCGVCGLTLLVAGRSFLARRGRIGRRWLLGFAISFLALASFVAYTELKI